MVVSTEQHLGVKYLWISRTLEKLWRITYTVGTPSVFDCLSNWVYVGRNKLKPVPTFPHRIFNLHATTSYYYLCGLFAVILLSRLPLGHLTAVPCFCRYFLCTRPNHLCQVLGWKHFEILASTFSITRTNLSQPHKWGIVWVSNICFALFQCIHSFWRPLVHLLKTQAYQYNKSNILTMQLWPFSLWQIPVTKSAGGNWGRKQEAGVPTSCMPQLNHYQTPLGLPSQLVWPSLTSSPQHLMNVLENAEVSALPKSRWCCI